MTSGEVSDVDASSDQALLHLGRSLRAVLPGRSRVFFANVDMAIGTADSGGGDIFNLKVCSPRWFEENIMTRRPDEPTHETVRKNIFGRHYLFVHRFDEDDIEKEVRSIADRDLGKDWSDIARRLSRYFVWEFEDYIE